MKITKEMFGMTPSELPDKILSKVNEPLVVSINPAVNQVSHITFHCTTKDYIKSYVPDGFEAM